MSALIKRNILLFLKDKTAVFFSFMAVFVVFFLYLCFLKDAMIAPLRIQFPDTAEELCNSWIMAGTLGIVTLTTSLSVLGILISDRKQRIMEDFQIAPISTFHLTLAYILSTMIITMMVALFTLGLCEAYIYLYGGALLSMMNLGKVLIVLFITIGACTCMLYVCLSFFISDSAFSNVTTIIGTLSGFLMGIYVPIGALPHFLQTAIRFFYPSHGASLLRQIMMEDVLLRTGMEVGVRSAFEEQFGLVFHYGDHVCTNYESSLLLVLAGGCFFCLAMMRMHRIRT